MPKKLWIWCQSYPLLPTSPFLIYQEVERLSRIDPLTEISNRRSFITDALRLIQLAIRHQKKLSCAMLDIDFFKQVNDTYGLYKAKENGRNRIVLWKD
ncbi:MAG: diguanylate cyclase [Proteobacteria bacterium]|nr:diguanylate cyclase [Pseudomonadota bacterium]